MIGPQQTTPTTNDCTIPSQKKKRLPYYLLQSRKTPGTYELRERIAGGDSICQEKTLSREEAASLYLKMNEPELTRKEVCTLGDVREMASVLGFRVLHDGQVLILHNDGSDDLLIAYPPDPRGFATALLWMCQARIERWGERDAD